MCNIYMVIITLTLYSFKYLNDEENDFFSLWLQKLWRQNMWTTGMNEQTNLHLFIYLMRFVKVYFVNDLFFISFMKGIFIHIYMLGFFSTHIRFF